VARTPTGHTAHTSGTTASTALWYPDDDPGDAISVANMVVPLVHAGDGLGAELPDNPPL
jgi:hypothetical protein